MTESQTPGRGEEPGRLDGRPRAPPAPHSPSDGAGDPRRVGTPFGRREARSHGLPRQEFLQRRETKKRCESSPETRTYPDARRITSVISLPMWWTSTRRASPALTRTSCPRKDAGRRRGRSGPPEGSTSRARESGADFRGHRRGTGGGHGVAEPAAGADLSDACFWTR